MLAFAPETRAEWVLTLYTGASHTYASTVHVAQPTTGSEATFALVSWAPHPFALGAPYYGVRLAWFAAPSSHVGVLIDFTHYKMYAETAEWVSARGLWSGAPLDTHAPLGAFVQNLELAQGVNLASLAAEYRWNPKFEDGPWQTHVGAGLNAYLPHAQGTINGVSVSEGYRYAGWGGQVFGGAEYTLPRRWTPPWMRLGLLVESKLDHGDLDLDLDPATSVETRVTTLHLTAGVSWHFE
jgi:hypothetical protein